MILLGSSRIYHCAVSQKSVSRCYYPNGNEARNDFPCNQDADGASTCCNGDMGYTCMTNKYCRSPKGDLVRGACTDPSFSSPECPKPCGNGTPGEIISGIGRFEVLASQARIWAEWSKSAKRFIVLEDPEPAAASTSTSTRVSTSSTSLAETESTTTTSQNQATDSLSPSSTPNSSNSSQFDASPSSAQSSSDSLSPAAKAGIAVGTIASALLLLVVLVMSYKLKKYKQGQQQTPPPEHGGYDATGRNYTPSHSNWSTAVTEADGNNGTGYVYGTAPKELPSARERPVNAQEMYDNTNGNYHNRPVPPYRQDSGTLGDGRVHGAVEMDGQGYR
ncbi:hypothetical protein B0T21DRAFT_383285 [Apiosordaria backusii]|uniref:Uncharacterized protein n=1 Tax=Apiosordaria backusii TaxID=314023 RepID=A0AA40BN93_9PEZI|nr:hypothetical protein B0T21DRAFT_383285 [Apiosordaria backusii]